MQTIINVPIDILKRRKGNKQRLECLACAIIIKSVYRSSILYLNISHVMGILGVSYKKAQKIIEWLKDDELFTYSARKNCVRAKSFKSKVIYNYGHKKGKRFYAIADTCGGTIFEEVHRLGAIIH